VSRRPPPRQRRIFRTLGLTGSIAMGKSTAAAMLRRLGLPVIDADAAVHALLAPSGAAVVQVLARFPGVRGKDGGVDRTALGAQVFSDPTALKDLEAILHPMVSATRQRDLRRAGLRRARWLVLDVPLLLEGRGHRAADAVMVVSAPAFLQRQRALARPGMTAAKLAGVLARQMPDAEKRRRADIVIPTGLGKRETLRRIVRFLKVRQRLGPKSRRRRGI
jgi:dephospho-CoA kinase